MVSVRTLRPEDWEAVRQIYLDGIATGNATFETDAPSWQSWDASHLQTCRLIAHDNDTVLGWAALTPVSGRCVYAGVAEVSVYIAEAERGKGVGRTLLHELIARSEGEGLWTLQAGIFPENAASLNLFRSQGFRDIGYRERIGKMKDIWRDTALLERRSPTIGQD